MDDRFYNIIVDKLHYEIRKKHDLEIVWLIYLLKYTDFLITQELHKKIIESQCDLAIIYNKLFEKNFTFYKKS